VPVTRVRGCRCDEHREDRATPHASIISEPSSGSCSDRLESRHANCVVTSARRV
jgi:hypothetical protein